MNKEISMSSKHRGNEGFTLVEVIAVLVILGILAAIAVPTLIDMRQQAEYSTLNVALNTMNSHAVATYAKSMMANDGTAIAGDQDSWTDLGIAAAADIFQNFAGTWDDTSATVITYTMANGGGDVTFTLTAGTASDPASIAISAMP
jgi:prepilin-type N-terminal cleavage/methylation domain-containing protein